MAIGNRCHSQGVVRFVCAQAGCPDCLETLLRENKGLIHSVIQKQGMGGIDYADLVQEGRIGLWLAIVHYDPARGYAFSTYAWTVIRYRLWRAHFYADRVEDDKNEAAEVWLELVDDVEEDWWQQHVRQALLEVVGKLPVRLGRLICLAYGLDGQGWHSLAVIGRRWGISRERARQLHTKLWCCFGYLLCLCVYVACANETAAKPTSKPYNLTRPGSIARGGADEPDPGACRFPGNPP